MFTFLRRFIQENPKQVSIREMLTDMGAGIDPWGDGNIEDLYPEGRVIFLQEVENIYKNPVFRAILENLSRTAILYTAREAPNMESVLFNRGKLAGFEDVVNEVGRFHTLYEEDHKKEGEFDKFTSI